MKLNWKTSSEVNNLGYEVQRSKDGYEWQVLDFVPGHETTYALNEYEFNDLKPFTGINYYRIKQVDFDGVFQYSEVRSISINKENEIKIFPNPTDGKLIVTGFEKALVKIRDGFGRTVKDFILITHSIDISELSDGLYFISVKTENGVITKRIIKE